MIGETALEQKLITRMAMAGFEESLMQKVIFLYRQTPSHQVAEALAKVKVATALPHLYENWHLMPEEAKLKAIIQIPVKTAKELLRFNPHLN